MQKSNKKIHRRVKSVADRDSSANESPALLIRHLTKSLLITLLAGIFLTLSSSLAAYFSPDPDRLIAPLALIATGGTALIGGFAAVRIHGQNALICGLLNGSAFMVAMMLLSLCFANYSAGYSAGISCLLHVGFVVFSVAGAYLGLKKVPKKKKRR